MQLTTLSNDKYVRKISLIFISAFFFEQKDDSILISKIQETWTPKMTQPWLTTKEKKNWSLTPLHHYNSYTEVKTRLILPGIRTELLQKYVWNNSSSLKTMQMNLPNKIKDNATSSPNLFYWTRNTKTKIKIFCF